MMDSSAGRFLTWAEVQAQYIRISRDTRDRWEAEGKFPKRITIGPRRIVWSEQEIIAWQRTRLERRDDADAAMSARYRRMPRVRTGAASKPEAPS